MARLKIKLITEGKDMKQKNAETFAAALNTVYSDGHLVQDFRNNYNEWCKKFNLEWKSYNASKRELIQRLKLTEFSQVLTLAIISLCIFDSGRNHNVLYLVLGLSIYLSVISMSFASAGFVFYFTSPRNYVYKIQQYFENVFAVHKLLTLRLKHLQRKLNLNIEFCPLLHADTRCEINRSRLLSSCTFYPCSMLGILIGFIISTFCHYLQYEYFVLSEVLALYLVILIALEKDFKILRFIREINKRQKIMGKMTASFFSWFENECEMTTVLKQSELSDVNMILFPITISKTSQGKYLNYAVIIAEFEMLLRLNLSRSDLENAIMFLIYGKYSISNSITVRNIRNDSLVLSDQRNVVEGNRQNASIVSGGIDDKKELISNSSIQESKSNKQVKKAFVVKYKGPKDKKYKNKENKSRIPKCLKVQDPNFACDVYKPNLKYVSKKVNFNKSLKLGQELYNSDYASANEIITSDFNEANDISTKNKEFQINNGDDENNVINYSEMIKCLQKKQEQVENTKSEQNKLCLTQDSFSESKTSAELVDKNGGGNDVHSNAVENTMFWSNDVHSNPTEDVMFMNDNVQSNPAKDTSSSDNADSNPKEDIMILTNANEANKSIVDASDDLHFIKETIYVSDSNSEFRLSADSYPNNVDAALHESGERNTIKFINELDNRMNANEILNNSFEFIESELNTSDVAEHESDKKNELNVSKKKPSDVISENKFKIADESAQDDKTSINSNEEILCNNHAFNNTYAEQNRVILNRENSDVLISYNDINNEDTTENTRINNSFDKVSAGEDTLLTSNQTYASKCIIEKSHDSVVLEKGIYCNKEMSVEASVNIKETKDASKIIDQDTSAFLPVQTDMNTIDNPLHVNEQHQTVDNNTGYSNSNELNSHFEADVNDVNDIQRNAHFMESHLPHNSQLTKISESTNTKQHQRRKKPIRKGRNDNKLSANSLTVLKSESTSSTKGDREVSKTDLHENENKEDIEGICLHGVGSEFQAAKSSFSDKNKSGIGNSKNLNAEELSTDGTCQSSNILLYKNKQKSHRRKKCSTSKNKGKFRIGMSEKIEIDNRVEKSSNDKKDFVSGSHVLEIQDSTCDDLINFTSVEINDSSTNDAAEGNVEMFSNHISLPAITEKEPLLRHSYIDVSESLESPTKDNAVLGIPETHKESYICDNSSNLRILIPEACNSPKYSGMYIFPFQEDDSVGHNTNSALLPTALLETPCSSMQEQGLYNFKTKGMTNNSKFSYVVPSSVSEIPLAEEETTSSNRDVGVKNEELNRALPENEEGIIYTTTSQSEVENYASAGNVSTSNDDLQKSTTNNRRILKGKRLFSSSTDATNPFTLVIPENFSENIHYREMNVKTNDNFISLPGKTPSSNEIKMHETEINIQTDDSCISLPNKYPSSNEIKTLEMEINDETNDYFNSLPDKYPLSNEENKLDAEINAETNDSIISVTDKSLPSNETKLKETEIIAKTGDSFTSITDKSPVSNEIKMHEREINIQTDDSFIFLLDTSPSSNKIKTLDTEINAETDDSFISIPGKFLPSNEIKMHETEINIQTDDSCISLPDKYSSSNEIKTLEMEINDETNYYFNSLPDKYPLSIEINKLETKINAETNDSIISITGKSLPSNEIKMKETEIIHETGDNFTSVTDKSPVSNEIKMHEREINIQTDDSFIFLLDTSPSSNKIKTLETEINAETDDSFISIPGKSLPSNEIKICEMDINDELEDRFIFTPDIPFSLNEKKNYLAEQHPFQTGETDSEISCSEEGSSLHEHPGYINEIKAPTSSCKSDYELKQKHNSFTVQNTIYSPTSSYGEKDSIAEQQIKYREYDLTEPKEENQIQSSYIFDSSTKNNEPEETERNVERSIRIQLHSLWKQEKDKKFNNWPQCRKTMQKRISHLERQLKHCDQREIYQASTRDMEDEKIVFQMTDGNYLCLQNSTEKIAERYFYADEEGNETQNRIESSLASHVSEELSTPLGTPKTGSSEDSNFHFHPSTSPSDTSSTKCVESVNISSIIPEPSNDSMNSGICNGIGGNDVAYRDSEIKSYEDHSTSNMTDNEIPQKITWTSEMIPSTEYREQHCLYEQSNDVATNCSTISQNSTATSNAFPNSGCPWKSSQTFEEEMNERSEKLSRSETNLPEIRRMRNAVKNEINYADSISPSANNFSYEQLDNEPSDVISPEPFSQDINPLRYHLKYDNIDLRILDSSPVLTIRLIDEKDGQSPLLTPKWRRVVNSSLASCTNSMDELLIPAETSTYSSGQSSAEEINVTEDNLKMHVKKESFNKELCSSHLCDKNENVSSENITYRPSKVKDNNDAVDSESRGDGSGHTSVRKSVISSTSPTENDKTLLNCHSESHEMTTSTDDTFDRKGIAGIQNDEIPANSATVDDGENDAERYDFVEVPPDVNDTHDSLSEHFKGSDNHFESSQDKESEEHSKHFHFEAKGMTFKYKPKADSDSVEIKFRQHRENRKLTFKSAEKKMYVKMSHLQ